MPTYCIRLPDGSMIEETMSMAEFSDRCRIGGAVVLSDGCIGQVDIQAQCGGVVTRRGNVWRNRISSEIGVQPQQRLAAEKEAALLGVPTKFNDRGDAVLESKDHAKRLYKALQKNGSLPTGSKRNRGVE